MPPASRTRAGFAKPGPAAGGGLSTERVMAAALHIVDTEGLPALSMRRLAKAVDREAMTLYRYAASKTSLLDGVTDLVLRGLLGDLCAGVQDTLSGGADVAGSGMQLGGCGRVRVLRFGDRVGKALQLGSDWRRLPTSPCFPTSRPPATADTPSARPLAGLVPACRVRPWLRGHAAGRAQPGSRVPARACARTCRYRPRGRVTMSPASSAASAASGLLRR